MASVILVNVTLKSVHVNGIAASSVMFPEETNKVLAEHAIVVR